MDPQVARQYVVDALSRYWPCGESVLLALPVPQVDDLHAGHSLPPAVVAVPLPDWAEDLAVGGTLLIPAHCRARNTEAPWQDIDWFAAVFWYLNGTAERAHEHAHGPIHSYSFRLRGWDARMWERAWVNRIALFLRRWAARESRQSEHAMFGPLPAAEILVTHDVDAIRKTIAIRLKRSMFLGFNALRTAAGGHLGATLDRLARAARFLVSSADYWHFDEIQQAEEQAGVRSCFYVYGGHGKHRSLKQALFDPAYDVTQPRLAGTLRRLVAQGWQVGLHQSFDAWRDGARMAEEKACIEEAIGSEITSCRQHWLRFSWAQTWAAQQSAGLEFDATLGFNDRPGFRNGAALRFRPWDEGSEAPLSLAAVPMILMDSHFYDYSLCAARPATGIEFWLDEVRAVRGTGTIIWHPHTLAADYGWRAGWDAVLAGAAVPPER